MPRADPTTTVFCPFAHCLSPLSFLKPKIVSPGPHISCLETGTRDLVWEFRGPAESPAVSSTQLETLGRSHFCPDLSFLICKTSALEQMVPEGPSSQPMKPTSPHHPQQ